jgi:tetratricopeptide (TPR) repeat protein
MKNSQEIPMQNSGGVLFKDLRSMIASGQVLAVVGAGVSVGATGGAATASWTGLLHDGASRAEEVGQGRLPPGWLGMIRPLIDSGDLGMMLSSAELITEALGGPGGGEYRRWLRESVGQLRCEVDSSVLEALISMGVPLATTNYDGLLEEVSGLPPVSWRDGARVQRVLRGGEKGILHLHGWWREPESVVLGIRSYEAVLGDATTQAFQRAIASLHSLLFVGFGAGLADPNFGALRAWLAKSLSGMEYRHFRLCRSKELVALNKEHEPGERIIPLSYGNSHTDLAPFLRSLASSEISSPTGVATSTGSTPVGLPFAPICVGRASEVDRLVAAMLASPPRPVPILGAPGIGKTTVALAALHDGRVAERFGDRRWFVRCDGATGAASLLVGLATELGLARDAQQSNISGLTAALGESPGLLILDNLETPWSADVLAVEHLLGQIAVPQLALVVTVRGMARPRGLLWQDADPLRPLALPDARAMFLAIAGGSFATDQDLDNLLEAVDRLPLAVELLAYNAQGESDLRQLNRRWEAERAALLRRPGGLRRELSLAVSFELSLASPLMTDDARRLLGLLGQLPDGVADSHLDDLLPGVGRQAASVLRQLALAFDDEMGRLRCLAPIREHMWVEHPPSEADFRRAVALYTKLAADCGRALGFQGGASASAALTAESGNVLAAILRAAELSEEDLLGPAVYGLLEYLRFTGAPQPNELAELLGSVRLTDQVKQANLIFAHAQFLLARSDTEYARRQCEEALSLYRQADSVLGEANCTYSLGDIASRRSDYEAAGDYYEQALALYREVGAVGGEAHCIRGFGDIAFRRSEYEAAGGHYEQALALYREVGDVLGEANCIIGFGDIASDRSEYEAAGGHYEQALALYRQVGDVLGEANCIRGFGDIAFRRSEYEAAGGHYEQALALYRQVGDVKGEANCINGFKNIALHRSDSPGE